jgi:hypothetical protein
MAQAAILAAPKRPRAAAALGNSKVRSKAKGKTKGKAKGKAKMLSPSQATEKVDAAVYKLYSVW